MKTGTTAWRSLPLASAAALALSLAAAQGPAQTVIVDDLLTDSGGCTTECDGGRTANGGGEFTTEGWVPHGDADWIVYHLGEVVVSGSVEFTVDDFAPYAQYNCGTGDQYVEFIGLSESPTCDHWANPQAYIMVLYAPGRSSDTCEPLSGAPNHQSSMRGALNLDCEWPQAFPTIYSNPETPIDQRFRLEWDITGARLYHTENPAEEPGLVDQITFMTYPNECSCECEQPLIQHICLGRTDSSVGWFDGPVFSSVVVTKNADYVPQACCEEGTVEEPAEPVAEEGGPDAADPPADPAADAVTDTTVPDRPDGMTDVDPGPAEDAEGCGCAVSR
jgi:hypothetical protein